MKAKILALLMLALTARADQVIFQPTSYSPPASLTIDAGVGLYGIWDFTGATVLGLPASGGLPVGGTTNQVLAKKSATDYDTQWVTPTGTGGGTPGGANTQVQFNDSGAFGGSAKFTFNKTSGATQITGDLLLDATSSSMATPRVFGIGTWQGGSAAQMQFGDYVNCFQALYGGRMQLIGFWGLEIYGGWQSASHVTFHSGGSSDPSVNIIGNTPANPILVVTGAASQTGSAQEWRDLSANVMTKVSPTGDLATVPAGKILWTSFANNASAGYDTGIGRNTVGVLEVNNGTAGTFADIKAKNVIATGAVTGSGTAPAGGANGSVLTKNSNTDYDYSWKAQRSPTKVIWLTAPTAGTPVSGTYTPTSGARAIYVEVQGAGGGSAGCVGTASNTCVGGGGAGGSYAAKYYATVSASYTYTVGGGGNGGAAGLTAGSAGDNTLFNSSPVLTGFGGGGAPAPGNGSTSLISGSAGGPAGTLASSNGDAFIAGGAGGHGLRVGGGSPPPGIGGSGGGSTFGTPTTGAANSQVAGVAGSPYGGGAAGAAATTVTGVAGAIGGNGAIKITEFF
jgi:hypothetical protein